LYTDVLDIEVVHGQRREFVKVVDKYAPEQLNRIRESLVLTRMTVASTMRFVKHELRAESIVLGTILTRTAPSTARK